MTTINDQYTATVYTRPGCMKCRATIRAISRMGIPVTVAQLDESPQAIKTMQANGWQTLPLVEVTAPDGEVMRWADMRKDDIDALAYLVKENA